MVKVFYTVANGGDGSYSVVFFDSDETIELLEKEDPETWGGGEGGGSLLTEKLEGVHIYTMNEAILYFLDGDSE